MNPIAAPLTPPTKLHVLPATLPTSGVNRSSKTLVNVSFASACCPSGVVPGGGEAAEPWEPPPKKEEKKEEAEKGGAEEEEEEDLESEG
jgi:hypothetical protein